MGLLDDAIREHLDLKRRRGADPSEIERAEREALGPVRRGPEGTELPQDDAVEPPEEVYPEESGEHQDEAHWGESFDEESELFGEEDVPAFGHVPATEEPAAPAPEPVPPAIHQEPPPAADEAAFSEEEATRVHRPAPEPFDDEVEYHEPSAPEPPPPPRGREEPLAPAHTGQETAEYDVEKELNGESEDVLEETPEFLQDTPDHDRLWFEQRPPRDFDFEG